MRKHNKTHDIEIWNAKTGDCFYFNREYEITKLFCFNVNKHFAFQRNELICQLKEVGCLVSDQNIYINIQDSTDPSLLEYNLEDTSCWLPFLK